MFSVGKQRLLLSIIQKSFFILKNWPDSALFFMKVEFSFHPGSASFFPVIMTKVAKESDEGSENFIKSLLAMAMGFLF